MVAMFEDELAPIENTWNINKYEAALSGLILLCSVTMRKSNGEKSSEWGYIPRDWKSQVVQKGKKYNGSKTKKLWLVTHSQM